MPVIEKDIPIPTGLKASPSHCHVFLDEMEVGDSVLIEAVDFNLRNMRATVRVRNLRTRKGEGLHQHTFLWAREEGYPKDDESGAIRIWRTA